MSPFSYTRFVVSTIQEAGFIGFRGLLRCHLKPASLFIIVLDGMSIIPI